MICANFYVSSGKFSAFQVSGHAGYAKQGEDIVCAGVSSVVMLTINTIDTFFNCRSNCEITENKISFHLLENDSHAQLVLASLYEHLKSMQEDYNEFITVKITEVQPE